MKRTLLYVFVCLALCACGANNPPASTGTPAASPSGPAAATAPRSYPAVGVVKAINPKTPSIEILHEDVEGLMPGMQMEFDVTDAALLNGIAVNDHIDFTIEDRTGVMKVTAIKKK
jgi:Cu(I)/Ag(I) efflux system periplasmic protein CusF